MLRGCKLTTLDTLTRRREQLLSHMVDQEYVALFHQHLRDVRGSRSQELIAAMADVAQSYISRVESGSTLRIGAAALRRILTVYKEMEVSDAC